MDMDRAGLAGCGGTKGECICPELWVEGGRTMLAAIDTGVCEGVPAPGEGAEAACEVDCLPCVGGACHGVPSSPVAKVRHEQKPSEDEIRSIDPSLALLFVSVHVQSMLYTQHTKSSR